ncbi:type IX secretion system membrane protein, PorP/SprF family [Filimonas lacunae]|uniref:Type IX secretion system membrane protein, PorP/SprF family n=1 Tax=Filimonas lacunae TaxID=477680 RepID=A0A173MDK3_9BACT|nr:PorP/SprF family type IX secretion system membrane protein [Filimonas lacunae]BAV05597.1 hypothetical protein FLA_1608 [Filimonas lacunae]SIT29251.1 type IX secretion system membrane protein, PorP/SprF family [Filimonas lacunae]
MKKNITLVVLLISSILSAKAQDVHFSQFFEAPILRNPALAGLFDGDYRIQALYRTQWGNVTVPYKTGSLSAEYKAPIGNNNDFITYGLQLLYDKAGTVNFTTTHILPAINYHKSLSDDKTKYLSLGVTGGFIQQSIDRSKMTTNNQYDGFGWNPAVSDGETLAANSYHHWDGGIGMSFNSSINGNPADNYYIGIAYQHINRPKNSFYKNPLIELNAKWEFTSGVRFSMDEKQFFTMYGNYSRQGTYSETLVGALYGYNLGDDIEKPDYTVQFGAMMRLKDAIIPMVKLDHKPYSVTFSYDANTSTLATGAGKPNAFEISLTLTGFTNASNSTLQAITCPRF